DIERGKRQQQVLKAIVDRTISLKSILKLDDVVEAVGANMEMSMKTKEAKSFVSYGTSGKNLKIENITLEGMDYQPGNTYFWKLDEVVLEETIKELQEHLEYEPRDSTAEDESSSSTNETATP